MGSRTATAGRRSALAVLAVVDLLVGGWALLDPRSFYEAFPFGRGWVAADGPFNEHLLRDFGAWNLAVLVVVLAALSRTDPSLVRLAGVVTLVAGVPHLVFHVTHLEPYGTVDAVGVVISLAVPVTLGAWLALWPARRDGGPSDAEARGAGVQAVEGMVRHGGR